MAASENCDVSFGHFFINLSESTNNLADMEPIIMHLAVNVIALNDDKMCFCNFRLAATQC